MPKKFATLTRSNMRKLSPGQKLTEHGITFTKLEGTSEEGQFEFSIMVDGIRKHTRLGKVSDGETLQQVEEAMLKARMEIKNKGRNPIKAMTFKEAFGTYLQKLKASDGKNIPSKEQHFRDYLCPYFGQKVLSKITGFDVECYKSHRKGMVPEPRHGTINRELQNLSHFFSMAAEWKWLEFKPFKIKKLQEDEGRIIYLTTDKIQKVLEIAKADQCAMIYPFIMVGLGSGMRRWEILSIRVENIDLRNSQIHIPKAKSGGRIQTITPILNEYLKTYLPTLGVKTGWIFPAQSKTGHTQEIQKPFRRIMKKAGLDPVKFTPHALRHTFITQLIQAGVDLPTVQRLAGHKSIQMTIRYTHQNASHLQEALGKYSKRIMALAA